MNPHQKPQEDVVVTQEDADLEAWFLRRMPDNAAWRGHIARLLARPASWVTKPGGAICASRQSARATKKAIRRGSRKDA